jgi:hypothetical protein
VGGYIGGRLLGVSNTSSNNGFGRAVGGFLGLVTQELFQSWRRLAARGG